MRKIFVGSIGAVTLLVGCMGSDDISLAGLTVQEADSRRGSAADLLDECPVNPSVRTEAIAALALGAAVPLLASFAVEIGARLIESGKEGLSGQFVAGTASTGLYNRAGGLSFKCVVIARGIFGAASPLQEAGDGNMTTDQLVRLGLRDYPAFYLELGATLVGQSVKLQPRYIRYAQSVARREGSGKKNVGLVLALSEAAPKPGDGPTDDKTIALHRFNLGRLEIGKSYTHHAKNSPLLTGTASQQVVPKAGGKLENVPFNLTAIVTETEEPSLLLEALSTSYQAKRGNLEKTIAEILKDARGQ